MGRTATGRMPRVTGDDVCHVLERAGWQRKKQKGTSHVKLFRAGSGIVIVPIHGSEILPQGTLNNILRMTQLSHDEFRKILC